MRKPDRRARRVRNTLNVDLGLDGLCLMDGCVDGLKAALKSRDDIRYVGLKRGVVVRAALNCLLHVLAGTPDPLKQVLHEMEGRQRKSEPGWKEIRPSS